VAAAPQSKEVFHILQKLLRAFEEKEDAEIAREVQKEELEGKIIVDDDFLRELRINEEFNRILAKGLLRL